MPTYLKRSDLLARGWKIQAIQAFAHDRTVKSPTGKGRPSFEYDEARVIEVEKGLTLTPAQLMPKKPKVATPEPKAGQVATSGFTPPTGPAIPSVATFKGEDAVISVNGTPIKPFEPLNEGDIHFEEVVVKIPSPKPNTGTKLDLSSGNGKGKLRLVVVDAEGNESLFVPPVAA